MKWGKKAAAAIGISAAVSGGCAVTVNETTIIYASESAANDKWINEHELEHQRQMEEMGGAEVFWRAWTDPETGCALELDAGASSNHFRCEGVDTDSLSPERQRELINKASRK